MWPRDGTKEELRILRFAFVRHDVNLLGCGEGVGVGIERPSAAYVAVDVDGTFSVCSHIRDRMRACQHETANVA
jgi:hypothetical protein